MTEQRLVNPIRLGKKSREAILRKFRSTFQVPFETENDVFEYLHSVGVKTRFKKPNRVADDLWKKAGNLYNEIVLEERKLNEAQTKKDKAYIKSVINFTRKPTSNERTFKLPTGNVMKKVLMKLVNNEKKLTMRIGDKYYPLNQSFIEKMTSNIENGEYLIEANNSLSSDEQAVYELMNANTFTLAVLDDKIARKKKKGGFFKYTHNVPDLDLTAYQIIYTGDDYYTFKDSCFIHAVSRFFEIKGIEAKDKIARAKSKMITRELTAQVIEKVAKELEVTITIKDERDVNGKNKTRTAIKNKGCELIIELGLIDEHYFLIERVPITKYALKNYKELSGVDKWFGVYKHSKRGNIRDRNRFITSYDVISFMFANKFEYLTELTPNQMLGTIHYDTSKDIDVYAVRNGDCNPVEYQERGFNKKKEIKITKNAWGKTTREVIDEQVICFFDFESTTDRGDSETPRSHQAYLVVYKTNAMNEAKCIEGSDCGKKMLEAVARENKYKPIRFIAHNVKYDFQFLYEHLYQVKKIQRGSMLLSANADFYVDGYKIKFNFVDSYSFIATKLSAFPKMFGFNGEKEIMPYGLWNSKTIKDKVIKLSDTRKYCDKQIVSMNIGRRVTNIQKDEYYNSFIDKAREWDCITEDHIDIIKYSKMYCIVDVEILEKGYNVFREWIREVCELDINHYITLPSVADAYMKKSGVYKDCYEISGSQLLFIQKCMVGGRTMTSENKMFLLTGEKAIELDDLDAVSLYPSAMKRMGGYLIGKPKILTDKSYGFLKSVDGYFVEITIMKVGIKRKFPLMSYITEDGVRLWTNDMVGKRMWVDKFVLEDLIEFQKVEFNIEKGYYYDEGRNYQIGETIEHLFNTRLQKKKEGNAIQQVYKLLMNSAYGRTLLKPFEDEKLYIRQKNINKHLVRHYDSIKSVQKLHDESYEVTQRKPIINHYNLAHIGVEVLSMSKRIMNEVMCLAEDIGVDIYYQDTDSTHTPVKDIPRLKEAYFKKYGRELEGNEMGQFNCDFESDKLKGKIRSVESVFLGKKCYVDKLQGDEEGVYDYHIRMKGVSGDAIADKLLEEDIEPIELYERLFNSEEMTFDLCCRGVKSCFETMSDGSMTTRAIFERNIKFNKNNTGQDKTAE